MVNLSQGLALGLVGLVAAPDFFDQVLVGARPRLRARFNSRLDVDISAGPYLNGAGGSWEIAVGIDDWIGVTYMREWFSDESRTYMGAKFGAWPGLLSGLLAWAAYGALVVGINLAFSG